LPFTFVVELSWVNVRSFDAYKISEAKVLVLGVNATGKFYCTFDKVHFNSSFGEQKLSSLQSDGFSRLFVEITLAMKLLAD